MHLHKFQSANNKIQNILKEATDIFEAIQLKNADIKDIHNKQTNFSDLINYRTSSFRSDYVEHSELLQEKFESDLELFFLKLVNEQESEFKSIASAEGTRRVVTMTSLYEKKRERQHN